MASTTSPNMFLVIPGVGTESGPQYAIDIDSSLSIIDQHNHSSGSGVQIPPAGLNISGDLTFQGNSLTNAKSVLFSPQATLTTPLSLYVKPGAESPSAINDLWYNDGNGTQVQITNNGQVNATATSLPGENYAAGVFSWKQGAGSTVPANFDIGSIVLRPNIAATSYGTTLQVSPSIASAFTLTLPNNPSALAGTSFLQMDTSGNITGGPLVSGGLTTANLSASAGILASQLATATLQLLNPPGSVIMFAGASVPTGYLLCNGGAVDRTTYAALFAAIGTTWGAGNGSTTFNVPNYSGIFPRGAGSQTISGRTHTAALGAKLPDTTARNGLSLSDPGHNHIETLGTSGSSGLLTPQPLDTSATQNADVFTTTALTGVTLSLGDSETAPASAGINFIIKT